MSVNSIDESDFRRPVVEILAKRAGQRCSNPDCDAPTSGPADEASRAVTVGEAAHIYGARPRAARYRVEMLAAERSDVTNGIWLCRNCHKIIDADVSQYPAELLFEWRRLHERRTTERLGKTGDMLRQKVAARVLHGFDQETYLAQQIVLDKPDAWEYRLMLELLRSKMAPTLSRWRALQRSLYVRPTHRIEPAELFAWFEDRIHELGEMPEMIDGILNVELPAAFGPRGQPGSADDIQRACTLFAEACQSFLEWEERVRFVRLPNGCDDVRTFLNGSVGRFIDAMNEVPTQIAAIFAVEEPEGHSIHVTLDMPPDWIEQMQAALRIVRSVAKGKALD